VCRYLVGVNTFFPEENQAFFFTTLSIYSPAKFKNEMVPLQIAILLKFWRYSFFTNFNLKLQNS